MPPKKPFRYWPIVAIVVLLAVLLLSNQQAKLPTGETAITTGAEYQDARAKFDELAVPMIQRFEAGEELGPEDLKKVRRGGELLDSMTAFIPANSGNYFLAGKVHTILGEPSIAIEKYRQCILVAPNDAALRPADASIIKSSAARASYEVSLLLLLQGDKKGALEAANAAVEQFPNQAEFFVARASALNELRRVAEAKRDLQAALQIDPNNARAQTLLRFISKG